MLIFQNFVIEKNMSKPDQLLKVFKQNVGKWVCAYCASNSNQPAAAFREVKKLGYKFEEVAPNRWGKTMFCPSCLTERTHYKLISKEPQYEEKTRYGITATTRKRILRVLGEYDAFSGASITSTPEIDHKVPWTRLERDIDSNTLNDEGIKYHFQLLTREHNLLKDRMCGQCKINGTRPPFFGVKYWYQGDINYVDTCEGCGWYNPEKWKQELNRFLKNATKK